MEYLRFTALTRYVMPVLRFCGTGFLYDETRVVEVKLNMPSAKILEQKVELVSALTEKLKGACSGVVVSYKGITVAEDTKLRKELREAGVDYFVVKNTMLHRAAEIAGLSDLDPVLEGTTALALSAEDYVVAPRILCTFAEKSKTFEVKAGFMDARVTSKEEVNALSKIPPKEILLAQVLGGFLAPISGLAIVLNQIKEKMEGGAE